MLYYPARYFITKHITDLILLFSGKKCSPTPTKKVLEHPVALSVTPHSEPCRLTTGPRWNAHLLGIHRQKLFLKWDKHFFLFEISEQYLSSSSETAREDSDGAVVKAAQVLILSQKPFPRVLASYWILSLAMHIQTLTVRREVLAG